MTTNVRKGIKLAAWTFGMMFAGMILGAKSSLRDHMVWRTHRLARCNSHRCLHWFCFRIYFHS